MARPSLTCVTPKREGKRLQPWRNKGELRVPRKGVAVNPVAACACVVDSLYLSRSILVHLTTYRRWHFFQIHFLCALFERANKIIAWVKTYG